MQRSRGRSTACICVLFFHNSNKTPTRGAQPAVALYKIQQDCYSLRARASCDVARACTREVYGAEAVDTAHGRKMADHLLVAHFVAGPRSQELRCSAALIARRVSCSDFRLPYLRADPTVNYVICRAHSRATSERSKPAYHPRKSWHPELISGALFRSDASLESDVSLESSELLSEPLNLENCGAMAHHW